MPHNCWKSYEIPTIVKWCAHGIEDIGGITTEVAALEVRKSRPCSQTGDFLLKDQKSAGQLFLEP